MGPYRYEFVDAYTIEELKREYQSYDTKDRIRMLQELYKNTESKQLPYEIAIMAIEDTDVDVRQWIARYGMNLDYRESEYVDGELLYKFPERNLAERLKNDPDPFVRACLHENPNVFGGLVPIAEEWLNYFKEATHMERLALVRNPGVAPELIERIFDIEDKELDINLQERKELILAYLTNTEALKESHRGDFDFYDGYIWYKTRKHFSRLWRLSSKWPMGKVNGGVYRYVGTDDSTRAEIYQQCDEPVLRSVILENCNWDDTKTIELGMQDKDEICRFIAYAKVRHIKSEVLKKLLQSKDTKALSGLARNKSLSISDLEKVRDRLNELNDNTGAQWAEKTIEQIEKEQRNNRILEDPKRLFGWEGQEGNFLEKKIDLIGKTLLSSGEEIRDYVRQIEQKIQELKDILEK